MLMCSIRRSAYLLILKNRCIKSDLNISDIILQYKFLDETQGFKVYFKTVDYDGTGEEVIISQIIPAGFDLEHPLETPLVTNPKGRMAKCFNGIQFITWHIFDKEFTVNLEHITKIEIIDNAIEEIMKEQEDIMTERRFRLFTDLETNDETIVDMTNGEPLSINEICKLLNKIYSENIQLQHELYLEKGNSEYYKQLSEEYFNEVNELKASLNGIKEIIRGD